MTYIHHAVCITLGLLALYFWIRGIMFGWKARKMSRLAERFADANCNSTRRRIWFEARELAHKWPRRPDCELPPYDRLDSHITYQYKRVGK